MKQMDTLLFQHGQSIDEIKNRLNCIETGSGSEFVSGTNEVVEEFSKSALMSDPEFVNGIVDNIMTNSNLADIIEQIDAVQSENQELRELFYAQQKTINEMNIMLLKLFSQSVVVAAAPSAPNPVAAVPVAAPTPVAAEAVEAAEVAVEVPAEVAAPNPVAAAEVAAPVAAAEVAAPNPVAAESGEVAAPNPVAAVEVAEEEEEEENVYQEVVEADA
jgi:hypothetical protein